MGVLSSITAGWMVASFVVVVGGGVCRRLVTARRRISVRVERRRVNAEFARITAGLGFEPESQPERTDLPEGTL